MRKRNKLVFGVGINDADYLTQPCINGKQVMCKYYDTWYQMLRRCYSDKLKLKRPTYIDCRVCDEWLRFSNFKAWMEKQDWEGKVLDKDILSVNNKIYSPDNCLFVSLVLNNFLLARGNDRGQYPLGVNYSKSKGKFVSRCSDGTGKRANLGNFTCPNEAHEVWRSYKHKLACEYADEQTDPRIAHALRQWYKPNGWYLLKEQNQIGLI